MCRAAVLWWWLACLGGPHHGCVLSIHSAPGRGSARVWQSGKQSDNATGSSRGTSLQGRAWRPCVPHRDRVVAVPQAPSRCVMCGCLHSRLCLQDIDARTNMTHARRGPHPATPVSPWTCIKPCLLLRNSNGGAHVGLCAYRNLEADGGAFPFRSPLTYTPLQTLVIAV